MNQSIRASILRTLLASPAWERPAFFGDTEGAYTAKKRAAEAGTSLEALRASGLAIQSELHGRAFPARDTALAGIMYGPTKAARVAVYKAAHGGLMLHAAVNQSTAPSGLRPVTIPSTAKPAHVAAWHAALVAAVAAPVADDALIEVPAVPVGDGAFVAPSGGSREPAAHAARPSAPRGAHGFRTLQVALENVRSSGANAVAALRGAEDTATAAPVADALAAWLAVMPSTAGITPATFDTSVIRAGVEVELAPAAPEKALVAFMATKAGAPVPATLRVCSLNEDGSTAMVEPFDGGWKRPVAVKVTSLRRVLKAPAAPKGAAWKPAPGSPAYLAGEMVFVLAVAGDTATVDVDGSGEGLEVPAASLTATAD